MRYAAIGLVLVLSGCFGGPVGNANVPEPQKPVELSRYLGKWYEIARYENRFERGCEDVTAEYELRPDGLIRVLNSCHRAGGAEAIDQAEGKAKIVDHSANAKLNVSFFGPFYLGDYWVLDRAQDYSWSIVGEPSGRYLWILARQPVLSKAHQNALVARVKTLGYDTSLLHYTKQNAKR